MILRMHVDNIMATLDVGCAIDTGLLSGLDNRKVRISAVGGSSTYRIKDKSTSVQIHTSGKIVFTSSDMLGLYESRDLVMDDLNRIGIPLGNVSDLVINNIVASGDLRRNIDLVRAALVFGLERTEYEPEQFPGLVYRMEIPSATILLFGNGKLICTGVTTPDEITDVARQLLDFAGKF